MLLEVDIEERNRLIGKNLRKYRLLKGMTQDELAEGLCSVSQLSKVENGKTYGNRTLLRQMAQRLGVSVERIEAVDPLLEEMTESLRLAKDATVTNNYPMALELVREVAVKSREFGYPDLLIEAVLQQCRLLVLMRDYQAAIRLATDSLAEGIAQKKVQEVRLQYELGQAYQMAGNVIAAYDAYTRADESFDSSEEAHDDDVLLPILFNLAQCHFFMRNYRTALRYAEKAELYATRLSKYMFRIRLTYMKAGYLDMLGESEKAEGIYLETLREVKDNKLLFDEALILNSLAMLYKKRREFGQAVTHLRRSIQLLELLQDDQYLCNAYLDGASIHLEMQEFSTSHEYVDKAFEVGRKMGLNTYREKAKVLHLHGQLKRAQGDFAGYAKDLEQALAILDQHHVLLEAHELAVEMAEAFDEAGDSRALEMYRKATAYHKRSLEFGMRR